jgi:hypothetical protein
MQQCSDATVNSLGALANWSSEKWSLATRYCQMLYDATSAIGLSLSERLSSLSRTVMLQCGVKMRSAWVTHVRLLDQVLQQCREACACGDDARYQALAAMALTLLVILLALSWRRGARVTDDSNEARSV